MHKKPKPAKKKPASREKFVKVEGTFEELIAKSVKPKGITSAADKPRGTTG